jgi:subtilase family serine protease
LASTPYNVAVGGTQFADSANPAAYWNAANDAHKASARSYIPETAWNESSYTALNATGNNLYAGGGGVSSIYAGPSWQTGAGVPTADPGTAGAHHRYLPDVSLAAAGHDGYLVYLEGALYLVGGTSASSPAFAGLMAIVDQYTGGRNGNPNTRFYSLAVQKPAAWHDVTAGSIAVPCTGGSAGCSTSNGSVGKMNGYNAAAGYDFATGLGSVDAYAMAFNWGARPPSAPTINTLGPNPMTGSTAAQTLTIAGTGFLSGATVTASYAGGSSTNLPVTSLSSTQIQATINTGTTARTWSITVANTSGAASNAAGLTVVAPPLPPVAGSVTPNPLTGSTAGQVITINGSGFVSGSGLKVVVGYPGGASTTLSGGQIAFVNSTQVLALITVGTVARTWTVRVVNPSGVASNNVNLQVVAPPQPPAISSLNPNPIARSTAAQTLIINGSGFQTGSALRVVLTASGASASFQGTAIKSASASQIQVAVNAGTTLRTWSVQVVNPNGTASNAVTLAMK